MPTSRKDERDTDKRTDHEHDRDRILYTSAFRRLAGVSQVVAVAEGHVFHNRLTHTLEVAQIGRRLGQKLLRDQEKVAEQVGGVDPEVVEAAALAHDLGHPPFGHCAEEELDKRVVAAGLPDGFEGNAQSFRIVTKLAMRYEDPVGLDLTPRTLNAILKYPWFRQTKGHKHRKYGAYQTERADFKRARKGSGSKTKSAEAELMDWADDVAYAVHDVEDFYRAGLIPLERLVKDSDERGRFYHGVFTRWKHEGKRYRRRDYKAAFDFVMQLLRLSEDRDLEPYTGERRQRAWLRGLTSHLITRYVDAISLAVPKSTTEPRVKIHKDREREVRILKELVWHYIIRRPTLAGQQRGQVRVIGELFEIFLCACKSTNPRDRAILPARYGEHLEDAVLAADTDDDRNAAAVRVAADVIAGMTEDEALRLHARLTGARLGSILNPIIT